MSKLNTFNNIRLIPREDDFLDRKTGARGEVFYDKDTNSLRLYDGQTPGGYFLAKSDLTNISNATFYTKGIAAGLGATGGGGGGGGTGNFELSVAADDSSIVPINSGNVIKFAGSNGIATASNADGVITISLSSGIFGTIAVAGQSNVVADAGNDTLTLVAGSNITITTDATTDTVTINSAAGPSTNSFNTIAVTGQSNVVADSSSDTLTLEAGTGIAISTNASTDTIVITNTATTANFSGLGDVSPSNLTVDKIYLPAITLLNVTNQGASAYRFDQYGSGNNPTIYALSGTTIAFNLQASGHPFLIQDSIGNNYNTGLVHVTTAGVVTTGSSAQGKDSGTLYWKVPDGISGTYRYQCQLHAGMVGNITVKGFVSI